MGESASLSRASLPAVSSKHTFSALFALSITATYLILNEQLKFVQTTELASRTRTEISQGHGLNYPTLFLLGVSSGSTTVGAVRLMGLPGVCAATGDGVHEPHNSDTRIKEIHFLDVLGHKRRDFENYQYQFDSFGKNCKYFLDGSPDYFTRGEEVVHNIDMFFPDSVSDTMKFVVILREQLARMISWFGHVQAVKSTTNITHEHALQLLSFLKQEYEHHKDNSSYIMQTSMYAKHLQNFFSRFHPDQFMILQFDEHAAISGMSDETLLDWISCTENCSRGSSSETDDSCVVELSALVRAGQRSAGLLTFLDELKNSTLRTQFSDIFSALYEIFDEENKQLYEILTSNCQLMSKLQPTFRKFDKPLFVEKYLPSVPQ